MSAVRGRRALVILVGLALSGPHPLAAQETPAGQAAAARLGLQLSSDRPMHITADELEARRGSDGRERIVFRRNVQVRQEEFRIASDWLEAVYGATSGRPDQIHARGSVRISQLETRVSCEEARYEAESCTLVCTDSRSAAELRRGDDVLHGREIHFDLCSGVLRVRGGARIEVRAGAGSPRDSKPAPVAADRATPPAPPTRQEGGAP